MVEVVVHLIAATICFSGSCHPVLVGDTTPTGTYDLKHYATAAPGYGGDILVYKDDGTDRVFAVHRVLNIPGQNRPQRLRSKNPNDRRAITLGCINVEPIVYKRLTDCCSSAKLVITR